MTLPELMANFDTEISTFTPSFTDSTVICRADPLRWALIIVPINALTTDPVIVPTSVSAIGIQITGWPNRLELNNRDHPGLPQQEFVSPPTLSPNQYAVIEIFKTP